MVKSKEKTNKKANEVVADKVVSKKVDESSHTNHINQSDSELVVSWKPKTDLGKMVKEGKITDIENIFDKGYNILEPEIVDILLPDLSEELLLIGQAKGKFGGGQRRIFRQTQKKTREGNKIKFATCAVVGNKNGYVGVGIGKSKETVPARDKSKKKARLSIMRVRRGSGSWESDSREPTSIPFSVEGKCGSVIVKLMPAPRGKGLCIEKECAKILELAGIKDIWSKTKGQTKTKLNMIYALIDALKKLSEVKIKPEDIQKLGIVEGRMKDIVKEGAAEE
ncbi:MAG: 30S ribosomal protein S5 [Nanoarchaeota archaeon]|nr:30S ribosomal protein S5 [Nanoarchaeota archaeon]MBU1632756.1 30S ribosomal protein S5 [Nanoarchaeota archaeon]MBU1876507.1 30S ribosomal protein S5 [Nanoarchaeota archaeon]